MALGTILRGILPVMATAFGPDGELDELGCERIVEYNVRAGAEGIVTLGHASEFASLTEEERGRLAHLTVKAVGGRVPVVVGASGTSAATARLAARQAVAAGADALMVMPPYLHRARWEVLEDYFQAVCDETSLPLVFQNSSPPMGNDLGVAQLSDLIRRFPSIRYVKEETRASPHMISGLRAEAAPGLVGVIGAESGRYMIQHHRRGAIAIMPACIMTELYVEVWQALERGDDQAARRGHERMLPLVNFFGLHGFEAYKEILVRRGVISSRRTRGTPFLPLDDLDREELLKLLEAAGLGPVKLPRSSGVGGSTCES